MNHQKIFDFFKRHGCTKEFKIVDSPIFIYWDIDRDKMQVINKQACVINESIYNIDKFIIEHLSDKYSTVYIYSEQDFTDDIKHIRYHQEIPDILLQRAYKINKIREKLNDTSRNLQLFL